MKRKLITALGACLVFLSITTGILASLAWFVVRNNVDLEVTGSFVEAYFHCGTGDAEDDPETEDVTEGPFVITRPIHYYHLVEFFQRITHLPSPSVHFGTDYLYFQVGYNLDNNPDTLEVYDYDDQGILRTDSNGNPLTCQTLNMAYYSGDNALMPIGTNEVPFIGSFDGKADKNIVIANLNIHCEEDVEVKDTTNNAVTQTHRQASDVGVFGYVADDDGNNGQTIIKNTKIDGLNIDLSGIAPSTDDNDEGENPDSHTSDHTDEAYVGYIVGHLHTYTNFSSTGPTNASPLYNVYVDNAKVEGGAGTICNYGYIGLVDTVDGDESAEIAGLVEELGENASGGGQEQGDEWGGSINFREFNMRFYNRRESFTFSTNKRLANFSNNYTKASLAYGSNVKTSILDKNPTTSTDNIVYNLQGSGSHTISGDTMTLVGTAMPLAVDDSGVTKDGNTGYIVSSSRSTSGSANGAIRSASYRNGRINNSLSDTPRTSREVYLNSELLTYDKTKTEILTNKNKSYNANGSGTDNFVLIKDELDGYNQNHTPSNSNISSYTKNDTTVPGSTGLNLKKYNDSRQALDTVLSGSRKVQGIHFMNATIAANNTDTLPTVKINKNTYTGSSYPLLKNCIDFNTKESGIINFFGGTYYDHSAANPSGGTYTVSSAECFFSLYAVDRDASTHAINSVKLLSYVHQDTRNSKAYIYQYSDGTYSDTGTSTKSANVGDVVFDMRYLSSTPPVQNALYYFEIPVNAGEFALGGVSGQDGGAYLLYLDISANAGGEEQEPTFNQENMISDSPLFTQIGFLKSSEDFITNSCFNIAYVIPDDSTKGNFSVTVSCAKTTYDGDTYESEEDGDPYTCYEIVIINTSGNDFTISALLMDDDGTDDEDYFFMYAITYNSGTRAVYHASNTYKGTSGGTTMTTPTYGENNNSD